MNRGVKIMVYQLEELTHDFVSEYFKTHSRMDVITKQGSKYQIYVALHSYHCFSYQSGKNVKMTKEMEKIFY